MTYEETKELEANVEITKQAEKIYSDFIKYCHLDVKTYKGNGRFLVWADDHNATYIEVQENRFVFIAEYIHNKYRVSVTPADIFGYMKNEYRGLDHLKSMIRGMKP